MFVFYWLIGVCGGSQPPQTKRVKSVVANLSFSAFLGMAFFNMSKNSLKPFYWLSTANISIILIFCNAFYQLFANFFLYILRM